MYPYEKRKSLETEGRKREKEIERAEKGEKGLDMRERKS
jgi:hypothetical protein